MLGDCSSSRRSVAALTVLLSVVLVTLALLKTGEKHLTIHSQGCRRNGTSEEDVQRGAKADQVVEQRQLLKRLYKHELGLPVAALRRAISYGGDPERLQRVMQKLIRGEPITVAAVGGSVTAGSGAITQNLSYRERVFHWIRATFPNDMHAFVNGALAAATSGYVAQCINDYAPIKSDIIFLEFTANDRQESCELATDGRRSFEMLLRKVLQYPNAPAVVVLHWWSPRDQGFRNSSQDHLDVFAKFYGVPALSWRDAIHHLIDSNASGFSVEDLYADKLHPNGYNGHRYFADIIISFLRNEAAAMVLKGFGASSTAPDASDVGPLQQPMLPGNYEGRTSCLRGKALQDIVVSSEGWQWKNDGSEDRPKWGYVSLQPGNKLLLNVSTDTYRGDSKVVIAVGTLKSYEHMGQAQLTCVSGCECEPTLLESHWTQRTSQTTWEYAAATQRRECLIAITTLNSTSSGEHKVFVNSFLATDVHEYSTEWFSQLENKKVDPNG